MDYESFKATEARSMIGEIVSKVYFTHDRIELTNQKKRAFVVSEDDLKMLELIEDWIEGSEAQEALEEAKTKGYTSHQQLKDELGL